MTAVPVYAEAGGLAAEIRTLLPPGCAVAEADPRAPATGLWSEEEHAITRAVEKRRREFAAGRRAVRAALAELGLAPCAVPMGPDRAPIWPQGLTGSISHTDTDCVAVVAPLTAVRAIGIDIEPALPLDEDLWPEICTARELAWLATQPTAERGFAARRIFAAKEAFYKAQYPLTGALLDFGVVELSHPRGHFRVRDGVPMAVLFEGAGLVTGGLIFEAALVRAA